MIKEFSDQNDWLTNNGFVKKAQSSGMAIDLFKLPFDLPPLNGLTVSTVTDEFSLQHWADGVSVGMFGGGGKLDKTLFLKLSGDGDIRGYVAYLDENPVATSMLFLSSGVAGLYLVSTLPDYRRRGIGTIMALTPLHVAKNLGYRVGVLEATETGKPVYQKIGFTELFNFNYYALE
jgi:ribosomal protein S18 acetylase RimI-like enzyme